ncbi:RNA-directed DNA polymerase, eukaryota, reverse transcriptase zinc-binding domain protein, partial [Tanacetum coccineum]
MLRIHDGTRDKAVWLDKTGKENLFSVRQIWKDLNYDETRVDSYKIVWFAKNIPRHAFVLWMAIQNRLSTQERIAIWKPNELNEIVKELKRLPNNQNVWSIVRRLIFGAVVYYTWEERNNRVFREEKRDEKTLIQTIKETAQLKIA